MGERIILQRNRRGGLDQERRIHQKMERRMRSRMKATAKEITNEDYPQSDLSQTIA